MGVALDADTDLDGSRTDEGIILTIVHSLVVSVASVVSVGHDHRVEFSNAVIQLNPIVAHCGRPGFEVFQSHGLIRAIGFPCPTWCALSWGTVSIDGGRAGCRHGPGWLAGPTRLSGRVSDGVNLSPVGS